LYFNFLAAATDPNAVQGDGTMAMLMQVGLLALIFGVFYFMIIRPQNKQKKALQQLRKELIVGDEVTTSAGIVGKVVQIKDDTVTVETGSEKTRIKFMRWAISSKGTQISE
jgi:preprotein translocase subunit YajC